MNSVIVEAAKVMVSSDQAEQQINLARIKTEKGRVILLCEHINGDLNNCEGIDVVLDFNIEKCQY